MLVDSLVCRRLGDTNKGRYQTRAAYDRSEHWPERVKIMQVWADYLDTLRTDGNVIAGQFGRAA